MDPMQLRLEVVEGAIVARTSAKHHWPCTQRAALTGGLLSQVRHTTQVSLDVGGLLLWYWQPPVPFYGTDSQWHSFVLAAHESYIMTEASMLTWCVARCQVQRKVLGQHAAGQLPVTGDSISRPVSSTATCHALLHHRSAGVHLQSWKLPGTLKRRLSASGWANC